MPTTCTFCDIAAGNSPAEIHMSDAHAMVITPLNPVTPGHVLVIPRRHSQDWTSSHLQTTATTRLAVTYAEAMNLQDCNLITSRGPAATQSVYHLHLHIVPRTPSDGLRLPWAPEG